MRAMVTGAAGFIGSQRPDMAPHRALDSALHGGDPPLYGDGSQTRDFTHVDDAVAGTLAAARRGRAA